MLDPFCGSGTVLLEGVLSKRNTYGADANPLARLIARVKVSRLDINEAESALKRVVHSARRTKNVVIPEVVNREYWFHESIISQLAKIRGAIAKESNPVLKEFLLVCFSNCVKKVSYADPRISVPVRLNPGRYKKGSPININIINRLSQLESIDVFNRFAVIVKENIGRFGLLQGINNRAEIISNDARCLATDEYGYKLENNSIQLIITSPPYAGAQKYVRASSLNLGWTGLANVSDLANLDSQNIGRESYRKSDTILSITGLLKADKLIEKIFLINPLRAKIVCNYIEEMKCALDEMIRVLKPNGFLVLIVGNNKVCNYEFNTQDYFTEYLVNQGLCLEFKLIDDIRSYGLMTKRNKTADIISREWILVFKKNKQ